MLKLLLVLLLYNVHAARIRVLSIPKPDYFDSTSQATEEAADMKMKVEATENITDFTLCLRVLENVYVNDIIRYTKKKMTYILRIYLV